MEREHLKESILQARHIRDMSSSLLGLYEGHNMRSPIPINSGGMRGGLRFVLVDPAGNEVDNISCDELVAYVASKIGTGTGGDPVVVPVLPATLAQSVPDGRPNGAVVAWVKPTTVGSPAPTWSMLPVDGLDIRTDTGDVFIIDATAFFALFVDDTTTVTTTITASNATGSAGGVTSCDVTLSKIADYAGITPAYDANRIVHFSVMDNRTVRFDSKTGLCTLIKDLSPEGRDGTNAAAKMSYAPVSTFGANRPALRGNGNTGATSGMYYNQNPIWRGIKASVTPGTSVDNLVVGIDQFYKNSGGVGGPPDETTLQTITLPFSPKGVFVGKSALFTVIADGDTLTYRLNGVQIGTVTLNSYNQPHYPCILMALVNVAAITGTHTILTVSALGQGRSWKGAAFNGDIGEIYELLNARSSTAPALPPPPPSTVSDTALTDHGENANNLAVYTFTNKAIGTANAARLVHVGVGFRAAGIVTISSVTIAGVEGVKSAPSENTSDGNTTAVAWYTALVPTGTTATVVVTLSNTGSDCGIVVYTSTVYGDAAPTKVAAATRGPSAGTMDVSLTGTDVGYQLALAYTAPDTVRRLTSAHALDGAITTIRVDCQSGGNSWTGITEDNDATVETQSAAPMAACAAGWSFAAGPPPTPPAFPDATTTGARGSLTAVPGTLTSGTGWAWNGGESRIHVTASGAVLNSLDVSGGIVINAGVSNVTISNCKVKVTASGAYCIDLPGGSLTVQDCTLLGDNNPAHHQSAINTDGGTITVKRCDMSNLENGIALSGVGTITDNYIHNMVPWNSTDDPHTDGIQLLGFNVQNGTLIDHNSILMSEGTGAGNGDTSAIISNATGHTQTITISNNRLRGGQFTLYYWAENGLRIINNRITSVPASSTGPHYGAASLEGGTGTPTISGNVDDDSGSNIDSLF